jgi:hypothetical protein
MNSAVADAECPTADRRQALVEGNKEVLTICEAHVELE